MQVRDLSVVPVTVPVKSREEPYGLAPYVSNHDEVTERDRVLVRLETTNGAVGWGEMLAAMASPEATVAVVEEVIAPELVGHPLDEIVPFVESFYHPYVRIDPFLGAVETAMWDALGRELGVSLSTLLGGRSRSEVPVAYCVGILGPEESAEEAAFAHEEGFTALKTKAGHDWRDDVDRLVTMDEATDGRLDLRIDPNQGWSFEEAVRAAAALEDAGVSLQYLEQPVRIDTYGTYARLRSRLRTPVAVNEDTYFEHNLTHLVKEDAIDVALVDLVPAGGIARVREQVAVARDAGVSVGHHCGFDLGVKTAAMLHTVASTPGFDVAPDSVYYGWEDFLLEDPLPVRDGAIPVPDGPGLGVTVDESAVETYRTD
ncbi:MAG: mandelate racemase/muconate lactonizing enzyme family protein [Haloferacaceae archaeon]